MTNLQLGLLIVIFMTLGCLADEMGRTLKEIYQEWKLSKQNNKRN